MAQIFTWTVFLAFLVALCGGRECSEPNSAARSSKQTDRQMHLRMINLVNDTLELYWVNDRGTESLRHALKPGEEVNEGTFPGHVFRAYAASVVPRQLVAEHMVFEKKDADLFFLPCGESLAVHPRSPRAKEFEELTLSSDLPCEGDASSLWSCVKYIDKEGLSQRDPELYGLGRGEAESGKQTHDFVDMSYVAQINDIPKVTASGPGYLRMKFTPKLMEAMEWWSTYSAKHGSGKQEFVPGGYTNSRSVELDILSLDDHRDIHGKITAELEQILEWWSGMPLKHTATYGVRTYHRGSVLIDHVDRHDTHVASAVLQMSQSVDVAGGWPLEVMLPHGAVGEVYLQPGELVLYEGAWLRHGRPMRMRGDNFSNVFVHFRPRDWSETQKAKANRYFGVPSDRRTTIADEGIKNSDQYGFLAARPHNQEI